MNLINLVACGVGAFVGTKIGKLITRRKVKVIDKDYIRNMAMQYVANRDNVYPGDIEFVDIKEEA